MIGGFGPAVHAALRCQGAIGIGTAAATGCQPDDDIKAIPATTTNTTSSECSADIVDSLGSTETCHVCVATHCCEQAAAFEASPTSSTLMELRDCATRQTTCAVDCLFTICGDIHRNMFINRQCADCLTASCCDEIDACATVKACNDCTPASGFVASCCGQPLYLGVNACLYGPCEQECQWADPLAEPCPVATGGGGAGGAGVTGGGGSASQGGGGGGGDSAGSGG